LVRLFIVITCYVIGLDNGSFHIIIGMIHIINVMGLIGPM
jgi:hypothetical protein